jgi:flagellar biosynthesis protein FlhG
MRTYCVTSGKGGVGKTTLSANLGIAFAKTGQRVVVFDADLALANLDLVLGVRPEYRLQHVLAEERTLSQIVTPAPGGIGVIGGGSAVGVLMASGPKRIAKFLEQLAELESCTDVLIFDTGAGLDTKVVTFANAADEILLVTTPEPTSVTDAYATVKVLAKRNPDASIQLIVNQVSSPDEGRAIHATLNSISESFLQKKIGFAGWVTHDDAANRCIRKRRPLMLEARDSRAAYDIDEIALALSRRADKASTEAQAQARTLTISVTTEVAPESQAA